MKQTIQWHENGLKNMKHYLEQQETYLLNITKDVERLRNSVKILEYQIASAKKEGKEGFDTEKYKRVKQ